MSRCRTGAPIIFTSSAAAVMVVAMVLGVASGASRSTEAASKPQARAVATEAAYEPAGSTLRLEKAREGVL